MNANNGRIIHYEGGGTSFNGPGAVSVYRAIVIANALKFYAKTGMKVNRAYTPSNMLRAAEEITGTKFKRGQYQQAGEAVSAWAAQAREGMDVDAQPPQQVA